MNVYRIEFGKLVTARLMYRSSTIMHVQIGKKYIQCPIDMYHETIHKAWEKEISNQEEIINNSKKEIEKLKEQIKDAKSKIINAKKEINRHPIQS